jgi:hypothetical protein
MKAFILKSLRAFFMGVADCIRKKNAVKNHITPDFDGFKI